jgi:hypothetical protein
MGTKKVIIWGKEEAGFDNDELGEAGDWAEHHMINCPQMKHSGIAYNILTKKSEGGGYVGITKIAECRACHVKYILSQYFIDAETGKYVKD